MSEIKIFGIRHHGPGSAANLLAALDEFDPEAVLLEGPPEGDPLLPLVVDAETSPPIALLFSVVGEPSRCIFLPLAEFSPEYQAIQWAHRHHRPLHFCDLPASHTLARSTKEGESGDGLDPLGWLSDQLGEKDREEWWDRVIESQPAGAASFPIIADVMRRARSAHGGDLDPWEEAREAAMRQALRKATSGHSRVAVVVGAAHVPGLEDLSAEREDRERLRGLPLAKVEATLSPWSHRRLSQWSGYGAGVASPGYYFHLWTTPAQAQATHWLSKVARLLRAEGLDASPASVVEAVRLAEELARLRGRQRPGLSELTEASLSVLTGGQTLPLKLIEDRLIVGDVVGAIPDQAPRPPLIADFEATCRRLRVKPYEPERRLELDLRKPRDREVSVLIHRCHALGIPWAKPETQRTLGTFKETWKLAWSPTMMVALSDAARWGTTVLLAAERRIVDLAQSTRDFKVLVGAIRDALRGDLPDAIETLVKQLDDLSSTGGEVLAQLPVLSQLAGLLRYGDVRQTDLAQVRLIFQSMLRRVAIGLVSAIAPMDDEQARAVNHDFDAVDEALRTLDDPDDLRAWRTALRQIADAPVGPGGPSGLACRILREADEIDRDEVARRLSQVTSLGEAPARAASWIEGFLGTSAVRLIHEDVLRELVDAWVTNLTTERFDETLPLIRRTFAFFPPAERRRLSQALTQRGRPDATDDPVDESRAQLVRTALREMLEAARG